MVRSYGYFSGSDSGSNKQLFITPNKKVKSLLLNPYDSLIAETSTSTLCAWLVYLFFEKYLAFRHLMLFSVKSLKTSYLNNV